DRQIMVAFSFGFLVVISTSKAGRGAEGRGGEGRPRLLARAASPPAYRGGAQDSRRSDANSSVPDSTRTTSDPSRTRLSDSAWPPAATLASKSSAWTIGRRRG